MIVWWWRTWNFLCNKYDTAYLVGQSEWRGIFGRDIHFLLNKHQWTTWSRIVDLSPHRYGRAQQMVALFRSKKRKRINELIYRLKRYRCMNVNIALNINGFMIYLSRYYIVQLNTYHWASLNNVKVARWSSAIRLMRLNCLTLSTILDHSPESNLKVNKTNRFL